jgi:hypothetical protein
MSDIFRQEWTASNYFDDDQCGVISSDGTIVIGVSVGLTRSQCEDIAKYHNEKTLDNARSLY